MLILSGVSGSGKSFLAHSLSESLGYTIVPSITTREPRTDEDMCKDRFFCSKNDFLELKKLNNIIFCKEIYGNHYAFDLRGIETNKLIFQLKYYYIKEFKGLYSKSQSIYIKPLSKKHTEKLLVERSIKNEDEYRKRIIEIDIELSEIEKNSTMIDYFWENNYDKDSKKQFINFIKSLTFQESI